MRDRFFALLGCLHIALGVTLNPWLLGRFLSPDGSIDSLSLTALVGLVDILLILLGAFTLLKRRSELVLNLNLLVLSTGIGAPLFGELLVRAGIGLKISAFRSPEHFGDYFSDDDYWKLLRRWQPQRSVPDRLHPLLGWSQARITPDNPLALEDETLAALASSGPKVLFYGDSFVNGTPEEQRFRIPEYLNDRLGTVVVNLSVGGYGLDQVYLLFRETLDRTAHQTILVGVLPNDDLDRTVLSFRGQPKPYFIIDRVGGLELQGTPIDQEEYAGRFRISFKSYLLTFLKRRLGESNPKTEEKQAISSRLLDRFEVDARRVSAELIFVLFYAEYDLFRVSWQEEFLKSELADRRLRFIDTKEHLVTYLRQNDLPPGSLYSPQGGHHNNLGNQVIGEGILGYLRGRIRRPEPR